MVIVALVLAATGIAPAIWGWRGWVTAAAVWAGLPLAHLVKHIFDLPDTLQPSTYTSITCLAAFSLVGATAGKGFGMLVRRFATGAANGGAKQGYSQYPVEEGPRPSLVRSPYLRRLLREDVFRSQAATVGVADSERMPGLSKPHTAATPDEPMNPPRATGTRAR